MTEQSTPTQESAPEKAPTLEGLGNPLVEF